MIGEHPIKQILLDTQAYWDHDGYPAHIRENLLKVIRCGTIGLGAEIYASETESKLVFHTCKSRFCTSCGQRATEAWQADLEAILPDHYCPAKISGRHSNSLKISTITHGRSKNDLDWKGAALTSFHLPTGETMMGELWTHRLLATDPTSARKRISEVCCPPRWRL